MSGLLIFMLFLFRYFCMMCRSSALVSHHFNEHDSNMSASPSTPRGTSKSFYFLKKTPSGNSLENQEIQHQKDSAQPPSSSSSWLNPLSWGSSGANGAGYMPINSPGRGSSSGLQKQRKVPIKIEPKVFFANERTFLAWLHMSVTLASISMAIVALADANEWSQMYGLLLMPVSIGFCVYSLWLYVKRAGMLRRKDPGPYDQESGPIVLATLLATSVVINFCVKLYDLA